MPEAATMIPAREAASLLAWWCDAGVNMLVDEVPVPWLERLAVPSRPSTRAAEIQSAASVTVVAPPPAQPLPAKLPGLIEWLITSPEVPGAGPPHRRIAPQGAAKADLMILVDMPEAGDLAAGHLISGEVGVLFDNMLKAIKLSRETVWIATLSPGRTPTGTIEKSAMDRLGEIARHHIALAAPKKLWLMGEAVSRAILKMEPRDARGRLQEINHNGGTVTAMVSYHPRFLHQHPARKREAWEDMQMLIGESKA
jgi:uracil-DNA glycosylase